MSLSRTAAKCLFAALLVTACSNDGVSAETQDFSIADVSPADLRSAVTDEAAQRFYEANGWTAVWDGKRADALIAAIGNASQHGLDGKRFLDPELPRDPARREAALTRAALAYASALANGVLDPSSLHEVYTLERPKTDVAAGLARALDTAGIDEWLQSLAPQDEEYTALSRAFLEQMREAQSGNGEKIGSGELIREGDRDPRVPAVVTALKANGYLQGTDGAAGNTLYSPQIAAAVRKLQDDFGIAADGIVGPDTLALLNTSARDRARKIAVNLERLRWLERQPPANRIDVNTADSTLEYFRDGKLRDRRRVVVGEAGWETPPLGSPIFRLVANPTWTVPKSIEEEELADKGADYLERNNMVRKDGWIVQQPGPDNALGLVKFDMQNDQAIYLHDTPHKGLFSANERHRSHGCVRVENAPEFARMIAADSGISSEFERAMASGEETFVKLEEKIPVRLVYRTAFLRNGAVQYRTDAYGWDEDIARALGHDAGKRRRLKEHKTGADIGP